MSQDYTALQVGQRVYYTGDMANQPAWCRVVKRDDHPRWGLSYDLAADDDLRDVPPRFRGIHPSNFSGPGRRFQVKEEYDAIRAAKLAQLRACTAACASASRTN